MCIDTPLHTFWQCQKNEDIPSDAIKDTQHLCPTAVAQSVENPVLWLRRILASHYPHPDNPEEDTPPIEDLNVLTEMPMEPSFWEDTTGIFYSDASGGKFSSFNRLRRIGCGACLCVHGVPKWSHYFNLPGPAQSVPRGELYAILYIVERVSPFSTIEIVTSNTP